MNHFRPLMGILFLFNYEFEIAKELHYEMWFPSPQVDSFFIPSL